MNASISILGRILIGIVMLVLLAAGVGKLLDLQAFHDSLGAWRLLPAVTLLPLSVLVPSAEIGVVIWWLSTGGRTRGCVAAVCLLGTFTAAYTAHLLLGQDPGCNCLGKLMQIEGLNRTADEVIPRNFAMIALTLCGMFLATQRGVQNAQTERTSRVHAP
jgi:hypothetical protein